MLIRKENKNSITCKISHEELVARGFGNMEDLMHDQVKARQFLNEILNEARETVDFKVNGGEPMNIQLAGLPDGSVNIRINKEKTPADAITSILQKCKDVLGDLSKAEDTEDKVQNTATSEDSEDPYEGVEVDTLVPRFEGRQNISSLGQSEARKLIADLDNDTPVMLPVVSVSDDLEQVISLCRELAQTNRFSLSDLYKYNGRYYLSMHLTDTKLTLGNSVFAISEFSDDIANHGDMAEVLREHGELICGENAIERLAEL